MQLISNALNNDGDLQLWGQEAKLFILLASFAIGPILAVLLNAPAYIDNLANKRQKQRWPINLCFRWEYLLLERAVKNNDFELLVLRSIKTNIPILFTLNTQKVYIGWIVRAPNPTELRRAVRIMPLASGYRNPNTHELVLTTDYMFVYNDLSNENEEGDYPIENFEVVLPTDQICASHLFDLTIYRRFLSAGNNTATTPPASAPC